MALHFSAEEVLWMQATLRHVRAELDWLSYAVNENVARLQQLWGYLELKVREMDRKQHEPAPQTPTTPTPPKRPWENSTHAAEARGGVVSQKSKVKDGK